MTISQSSELTDGLVNEKLGLDQPSSQVQSSSNPSTSPYAAANVSQGNPPTELPITDAQVKSDQPVNGDAGTSAVPDIEEKELSQPTNNVPQLGNPLPNPAEDVASPSQAFEHSRDLSSNEHGGGEHGELPPRPSSTVSSVPAVTSHSHLGATLIPQVESLGQRSPTPPAISRGPTPPPMKEEPGQTTDKDIPQTPGNGQFQPESNLENDLALAQQGSTVPTTSDPVQQDSTTPSGQPAPLPSTGPLHMQTVSPSSSSSPRGSTTIAPDRPLDMKGISSSDVFPDQRQRKASLTSRLGQLGQAFGRGSGGSPRASGSSPRTPSTPDQNTSAPAAQSNAKSPSSPTIAKFINSNLVKNFGRRVSGSTSSPTASPRDGDLQSKQEQQGGQIQPDRSEKNAATGLSRVISDAPPPVPPKDHPSPIAEQADHRTTNLDPPATFDRSIPPTPPPHDLPNNPLLPSYNIVSSSNPPSSFNQSVDKTAGQISPSPSAKLALSAARENTVKNEMEIQERFRRDQEEKMRLARERAEAEEAQAPVARQPDDAMDDSEEEGLPYDRPTPPQSPARPARRETGATNGTPTRAIEPQPHQGLPAAEIASPDVNAKLHALDMAEAGVPGGTAVALSVAAEQHAKQLADEREESTTGPTSQGVGNEALSNPFIPSTDAEVQDGIQAGPVPNVDEERNAGAEAEEQAKLRAEAQAQLETETQARLATEARERDRLEAEKARLEADRLKKAEEERQALEMKAEAERQRKAQLRAELLRGKQSGGNMLSGVSHLPLVTLEKHLMKAMAGCDCPDDQIDHLEAASFRALSPRDAAIQSRRSERLFHYP